jgi:hypothetical protein
MRKFVVFVGLGCVVLGIVFAPSVRAEGRGFHVGAQAGFAPSLWFYDTYCGGIEIGWQFSSRLGLRADVSAGSVTFKTRATSEIYESSLETRYASLPVCLSFLYAVPISDAVTAYLGAGAGFYSLTIEETSTEEGYYTTAKRTETNRELNGIAPHLSLGLESRFSKRLAVFGEVRQSLGRKNLKIEDGTFSREQDVQFGGFQLKAGVRLYFKD